MKQMKEIIKYDNTLNTLKFTNFTQRDFDFFWAICTKVSEKGNLEIRLSFQELRELINYKETDKRRMSIDLYRMFQKLLRIVYKYEDDETIIMFNLFSKFKVFKIIDELQVGVSEEFLPLLNNLENCFTSFELKEFIELTSKHSKTLYRILKQWKTQGNTKNFTLESLKEYFDCENFENKDFLQKVLKVAIDEILEKNFFKDLTLNVNRDFKKRGRPIRSISFAFSTDNVNQEIPKFVKNKLNGKTKESLELKSKNNFNNFIQREYTKKEIGVLEKKLLNK